MLRGARELTAEGLQRTAGHHGAIFAADARRGIFAVIESGREGKEET